MSDDLLKQLSEIVQACVDADGILIVDAEGIIRYHRIAMNYYWKESETVGRHILELYPELDSESSTILRVLRTGQAIRGLHQELMNSRGEQVVLDATTLPILSGGKVAGAVDCARFYVVGRRIVRGGRRGGLSTLDRIVTQNPVMDRLKRRIQDAAQLDSPVLIYGETGTGKELVAEALHSEGKRCAGPFVAQNCAAIPSNLLESLFFGTERGSYTGAVTRKGLFEEADGGTLFLDEVNSMEPSLQAKLLKVLESKRVRRLGGSQEHTFDVRVVAAVNEPPLQLVKQGKLREDLYYRLGVVRLILPPLRDRPEDISLLTEHFIELYNHSMGRSIRGITAAVTSLFQHYTWPGNIRELRNVIESAFVTAQGQLLDEEDVADSLGSWHDKAASRHITKDVDQAQNISLPQELERYECSLIQQAMEQTGSISAAARRLGLSRQGLKYKLQKYNL